MREITLSQAVNEALAEEMRRDETVFIIGEDVAEAGTPFKVLSGLVEEFGTGRVDVILSLVSSASQMPTATASSPEYICVKPGILADRYSWLALSSNVRIRTIWRYMRR